jgi:HEXXH motif-containing protein
MAEQINFAGFSCPHVGLDQDLLDLIVTDHADQLIAVLLERHSSALAEAGAGLDTLFDRWLRRASTPQFNTVWHAAFGDVHALLLSEAKDDLLRSAAALGLRLNECGQGGSWQTRLPAPASLRFAQWVLPRADALKVDAAPDEIAMRLRTNGHWRALHFQRTRQGGWSPGESRLLIPFQPSGHPDFHFQIASDHALSPSAAGRLLHADAYQFDHNDMQCNAEWPAICQQALALLSATSSSYVTWVDRVLRDLVPLRARPAIFNSGSEKYSPGVICVCDHPYRWPLAEMLVHEASHQYLHIINRLGPIDDGSDSRLYYSPFRNKERPIFYIVAAYHAFGNVLLFYRNARALGMVPDQELRADAFVHRERTLEAQLRQLEAPLQNSGALTELGNALWEPLHDALEPPGSIHRSIPA